MGAGKAWEHPWTRRARPANASHWQPGHAQPSKLPKFIYLSKYLFCFRFISPKGFLVGAGRAWEHRWTRRGRPANASHWQPGHAQPNKLPKSIYLSKYLFCFRFISPKGFLVCAGRAWEAGQASKCQPLAASACPA